MGNAIKFIITLAVAIVWAFSMGLMHNTWIGFYYPDINNISHYKQSPEFNSYDECLNWNKSQIVYGTDYDYECGKNCRFDKQWNIYMCEETI